MEYTVFYAWQSDTDQEANRFFIRDALKRAIKLLRADASVDECPTLDHDTKGISGTPDIFSTILDKIATCGIFLGDVTSVATTDEQKKLPNPNVMLEAGVAFSKVGDRRVLLILNEAYGAPSDLPFDLARRRWPLTYTIEPGTTPTQDDEKALAEKLRAAIRAVLESGPVVNVDQAAVRRLRAIVFDPSSGGTKVHQTTAEHALLPDQLPRAAFMFLDGLPDPMVVCANELERTLISELLDSYAHFRRAAAELDAHAWSKIGDIVHPNTYLPFWKVLAYYALLVADGHDRPSALRACQLQNIIVIEAECARVASELAADAIYVRNLDAARQARDRARAAIGAIKSKRLYS